SCVSKTESYGEPNEFSRIISTDGITKDCKRFRHYEVFPGLNGIYGKSTPRSTKEKTNEKKTNPPRIDQAKKKKVAFFSGCLMDKIFMKTNDAKTKLLQHAGCEIVIPETQGCCGSLHGHSGEFSKAREMAKKNIRAFEDAGVDYIITNAGGCGAFLVDYDHLLKDDPEWSERADAF